MDDLKESTVGPAVGPPVMQWLRLEGLAVAALAAVLYARTGASWWWFAGLWLVPDLSFLAFFGGSRIGSYAYNTMHSYLMPAAFAVVVLLLHREMILPYALIWFNHIGVDRMLGYGLKYPGAFGQTHLKHLGH